MQPRSGDSHASRSSISVVLHRSVLTPSLCACRSPSGSFGPHSRSPLTALGEGNPRWYTSPMARKKAPGKKPARKKKSQAKASVSARAKRSLLHRRAAAEKKPAKGRARNRHDGRYRRGHAEESGPALIPRGQGLGPEAGGQSGDVQGLRSAALGDSESVEELVEDGQAFEAEAISGVENAPDPDEGEIRTRQVPQDDVPPEYLETQ
jgi:hypothetical protein